MLPTSPAESSTSPLPVLDRINAWIHASGIPGSFRGHYRSWRHGFTGFKPSRDSNILGAQWCAAKVGGPYIHAVVGRPDVPLPVESYKKGMTFSLAGSLTYEDLLEAPDPYRFALERVLDARQRLFERLDREDRLT
jgi:hypothetical protein